MATPLFGSQRWLFQDQNKKFWLTLLLVDSVLNELINWNISQNLFCFSKAQLLNLIICNRL